MHHPKKLLSLDVLRAIACLWVWVSHIRVATQYFKDDRYNYMQLVTAWGHEMVIVFFILSGVVINLSCKSKTSRKEYFRKRLVRVYPIYLAVLLFCFTANYFLTGDVIDKESLIGNTFMLATLQSYIVPVMPFNAAVWSVTCESFFYLIFGLIYTPKRLTYVWIWFALSVVSLAFRFIYYDYGTGVSFQLLFLLNSSFLWLLGYLLFEYRERFTVRLPVAVCSALMIPLVTRLHQLPPGMREFSYSVAAVYLAPIFVYLLKGFNAVSIKKYEIKIFHLLPCYFISLYLMYNYSDSLTASKLGYTILPILGIIFYNQSILNNLRFIYRKSLNGMLFIARISYPLYLIHMPVMYLTYRFLPEQKALGILVIVLVTIASSYFLEVNLFERLTKALTAKSKQVANPTSV